MPGANTALVGPPLWRFLYTFAAYIDSNKFDKSADALFVEFVGVHRDEFPCRFCRASFKIFWRDLPPLEDAVKARKSKQWISTLQSKVNRKLDLQVAANCLDTDVKDLAVKDLGLGKLEVTSPSGKTVLIVARYPGSEVVDKRARLTFQGFLPEDLVTVAFAKCVNYEDKSTDVDMCEMQSRFLKYFQLLHGLLEAFKTPHNDFGRIANLLKKHMMPDCKTCSAASSHCFTSSESSLRFAGALASSLLNMGQQQAIETFGIVRASACRQKTETCR